MEAHLASKKTTRKKTTRAQRRRKGEPAWLCALADSEAPEEILLAARNVARRLGVGAQRGRPVIEIDDDSLASLGRQGCTNEGIADILGISRSSLQEKLSENAELRYALTHARAMRHHDLRAAQTSLALSGNARMLEWLGIQELGQRKKYQVSGEPGQPAAALTIAEMVMIGSEHRRRKLAEAERQRAAIDDAEAEPEHQTGLRPDMRPHGPIPRSIFSSDAKTRRIDAP
jgi:hypothetical protein